MRTIKDLANELDEVANFAMKNAKASKIADDQATWKAHARAVKRIAKQLRSLPPQDRTNG